MTTEKKKGPGMFAWRDVPPFAILGGGFAVYEMIAHGYHVGWMAVVLWCCAFTMEHLLRKAAEREVEDWKRAAFTATRAGALLIHVAKGGGLEVARPPDGMSMQEAQAALNEIMRAITRADEVIAAGEQTVTSENRKGREF